MFAAPLLLALATISPSTTVHLVSAAGDTPVHSARLVAVDQRLAELPTSWSTPTMVTAITGFSVAGVSIIVAPILGVSSFVGLFFAAGFAILAGLGIIVAIVACVIGAVGLGHANAEREELLRERNTIASPPPGGGIGPSNGAVLAHF